MPPPTIEQLRSAPSQSDLFISSANPQHYRDEFWDNYSKISWPDGVGNDVKIAAWKRLLVFVAEHGGTNKVHEFEQPFGANGSNDVEFESDVDFSTALLSTLGDYTVQQFCRVYALDIIFCLKSTGHKTNWWRKHCMTERDLPFWFGFPAAKYADGIQAMSNKQLKCHARACVRALRPKDPIDAHDDDYTLFDSKLEGSSARGGGTINI